MEIIIIRTYYPSGTNGILTCKGNEVCKTIELPWKDNLTKASCIPEGTYKIRKRYSRVFRWHFEVENVPGRNLILFHPANDAGKELRGCIAPVTTLTGQGIGLSSKAAFKRMKDLLFPVLESGIVVNLIIRNTDHEKDN